MQVGFVCRLRRHRRYRAQHAGTDLAAESGEQVLACGNGVVKETYTDNMLGNVAVIDGGAEGAGVTVGVRSPVNETVALKG